MKRICILGGGPAGVGAAHWLRSENKAQVTLLERASFLGGNAGSFDWNGHRLDHGSHRLHPSCEPSILNELKQLLGDDLLDRPRHGRIRLLKKWVHFPLKPGDLLLHLDKRFALGAAWDSLSKRFRSQSAPESFASVLEQNLGRTICTHFYFPYAKKIWGEDPKALSAIQAKKRVSAGTVKKILRKVVGQIPGLKAPGAGRFYYPRQGFGQITERLGAEAQKAGGELRLNTSVTGLVPPDHDAAPWRVQTRSASAAREEEFDFVWSTIPITAVDSLITTGARPEVQRATQEISYRSMILVYLEIPVAQFTPFDAHYFPEAEIAITRLSEPKNYAVRSEPKDRTVLCAELPCALGDATWQLGDEGLSELVARDLQNSGIPLPAKPTAVITRRLPEAYPLYRQGYEAPLTRLDAWASALPRFLSYGRQGLFAHDNTHHALAMARAAVNCFNGVTFDAQRWANYRLEFAQHVVED